MRKRLCCYQIFQAVAENSSSVRRYAPSLEFHSAMKHGETLKDKLCDKLKDITLRCQAELPVIVWQGGLGIFLHSVCESDYMANEPYKTDKRRWCSTRRTIINVWKSLPPDGMIATNIDGFSGRRDHLMAVRLPMAISHDGELEPS